jgi:hypothetical protein
MDFPSSLSSFCRRLTLEFFSNQNCLLSSSSYTAKIFGENKEKKSFFRPFYTVENRFIDSFATQLQIFNFPLNDFLLLMSVIVETSANKQFSFPFRVSVVHGYHFIFALDFPFLFLCKLTRNNLDLVNGNQR